LPLTDAIQGAVLTVPPDATLEQFVSDHLRMTRRTTVPVVDGTTYLGLAEVDALTTVARGDWATTPVSAIVRDEAPHAAPAWTIAQAVRAMDAGGCDLLPVIGTDGAFVGIVTTADLIRLDEILRATNDRPQG
jgi:predicted transcriptional regulator